MTSTVDAAVMFGIHYSVQGGGRDGGGEHTLPSIIHQSEL